MEHEVGEGDASERFTERLRAARGLRGWTQVHLARRSVTPQTSIAHFEAGARKPSFDTLQRLATALDVATDYLFGRVSDPTVAASGDTICREAAILTAEDRELVLDFVRMLAQRRK